MKSKLYRSWRVCLAAPLLLYPAGCDRSQPLEPAAQAASSAASGPTVNAPSGTNAIVVSVTQIDVSWQDNSKETGFEVHRSTSGPSGTFTLLATTGRNATTFANTGLVPSTAYCYKLRAFKTADGRTSYSQFSPTACATTFASEPPPAPPAPSADVYPQGIGLIWVDNSINEDGFKIERCPGVACSGADFIVIATIGANNNSFFAYFFDYYVEPGTTYSYRVRAFNSAGDSAPSDPVSATACFVEVSEDGFYVCSGS